MFVLIASIVACTAGTTVLRCDSLTARALSRRPPCHSVLSSRTPKRSAHLAGDRRHGLDQRQQLGHVVPIGSCQSHGQGDAVRVSHQMMFRAFFPAIRGVGAWLGPPKTARTEAESTTAREKSIWSARRNWLSKTRWMLFHTPAFCQSRRRRQQVMPEPQPISWGRSSHAIPVLSTKRMPVRTARSSRDLRPGYRNRLVRFGSNGSMMCHSSSSRISLAMRSLLALISSTQLLMLSAMNLRNTSFRQGLLAIWSSSDSACGEPSEYEDSDNDRWSIITLWHIGRRQLPGCASWPVESRIHCQTWNSRRRS